MFVHLTQSFLLLLPIIPMAYSACVDAALQRTQCVNLYESSLPSTPDGSAIRNYVHVQDLVRAMQHVLVHQDTRADSVQEIEENFSVWNVAGNEPVSTLEFIDAARQVSNLFIPICFGYDHEEEDDPTGVKFEPARIDASAEKLHSIGWQPEYQNIHDILATSWKWTKKRSYDEVSFASDISKPVDVCVIGAGLSGSVLAERHASQNKSVLVIEKRDHIGGNCYDYIDKETGIRVSKYGVHLFHTQSERVWNYLKQFSHWTDWE